MKFATLASGGRLARCPVSGDELVGNVVEVFSHDVWLRTYSQDIVVDAFDQRCLPTRCDGAEGIPGVTGDKTKLRRPRSKFFLDIGVSLARRLMVLHAIGTEASFEQIDDAAVLELACLNLEEIICEGEQPVACIAQLSQGGRDLGVRRHC
jgi:hypothetical protein